MEKVNINEICKRQHELMKAKGFYDNPLEIGTLLMLIVSELGEALEADRTSRWSDLEAFESILDEDVSDQQKTEAFKMSVDQQKIEAFKIYVKDTFEDEIADVFLRLFDLCGYMGIDIDKNIKYKMWYNSTRPYLHKKAY